MKILSLKKSKIILSAAPRELETISSEDDFRRIVQKNVHWPIDMQFMLSAGTLTLFQVPRRRPWIIFWKDGEEQLLFERNLINKINEKRVYAAYQALKTTIQQVQHRLLDKQTQEKASLSVSP